LSDNAFLWDDKSFYDFVNSLDSLVKEIGDAYGAHPVYSASGVSAYWKDLKLLFDKGQKWLCERIDDRCDNGDRHKYSALLFVVLLKKPLFKTTPNNSPEKSIGYYSAEIHFAWKAAIHLLSSYIAKDTDLSAEYIKFINKNGVSVPSENYVTETLRSLQMSFRPFKKKEKTALLPPPFDSMLPNLVNEDKIWGFVLLFANVFSLIESYSRIKFERDLLHKNFKKQQL